MMMYDVILMLIFMFIIDGDSSEGEPRHAIRCKYATPGKRERLEACPGCGWGKIDIPKVQMFTFQLPYVEAASSSLCQ